MAREIKEKAASGVGASDTAKQGYVYDSAIIARNQENVNEY